MLGLAMTGIRGKNRSKTKTKRGISSPEVSRREGLVAIHARYLLSNDLFKLVLWEGHMLLAMRALEDPVKGRAAIAASIDKIDLRVLDPIKLPAFAA